VKLNDRAVFFDFDGVIADSVDVKTNAFVALYAGYGRSVMEQVRSYHLANLGMTRALKFAYFQREIVNGPCDDETIAELGRRFGAEVKSRVIAAPEIAGARESIQALSAHVPLFIVSATPDEELVEIVTARGIAGHFAKVHGSSRSKSEAVAELLAASRLDPQTSIFLGDAMADFNAAAENRVGFVGVVCNGQPSPFPEGTETIPHLVGFGERRLREWLA
jgi:phosphoglycolate phosphatase-like HAD superfamily hydrolase